MFSAVSEIVVTGCVIYGVLSNGNGKPLMKKLLGAVFSFELLVNIVYMAQRSAKADTSAELSKGMKIFFALHGTLSLAMFIMGVVFFILAVLDDKAGKETFFQRHKGGTWAFVFFWMVSFVSGEVIFFMHYGKHLFGG